MTKRAPKRRRTRKRQAVERHAVKLLLTVHELTKNTGNVLKLQVHRDETKIGEIRIGRGSFQWYGGHRQRWRRFSWTDFAKLMDEAAYGNR